MYAPVVFLLDFRVQCVQPHKGQSLVAGRLRDLLQFGGEASEITKDHYGCGKVQDAYTLRCIPQVHGVVHDTIKVSHSFILTLSPKRVGIY